jgi:hypothetical protein
MFWYSEVLPGKLEQVYKNAFKWGKLIWLSVFGKNPMDPKIKNCV